MTEPTRQDIDNAMSRFYLSGKNVKYLPGRQNPPVLTAHDRSVTKVKKEQMAGTKLAVLEANLSTYCQLWDQTDNN